MDMLKNRKGFTLIELLVVIGILAILLAITLIAINPARQFQQANDTRRRSDILQILNAVHQYVAENKGNLPTVITTTATEIGGAAGQIDLCPDIMGATGKYIPALPTDPSLNIPNVTACNATYHLGYLIVKDTNGRITVSAPVNDVTGDPITVTR
jgi:type IV pilus assembly protein PilA